MSKEKIQDLRLQVSALNDQIWKLETQERMRENAKLEGKCFVYRNSYSCPGPNDYWNLYQRVLRVSADGNVQVFSFQTDKNGVITIETKIMSASILGEKISAAKFRAAWKSLRRYIDACDSSALGECDDCN